MPMDLHWLKPLLGRPSPFTTVYLDATRTGANADAEAADRWRAVRRSLERDGAAAGVLDDIAELVSVPTGVRGPHGRVVVADAEGVVVDRVLSEPPAQSYAVNRIGADLTWGAGGTVRTEGGPETESVDGGHDDVHKTREGGLDRRSQTRAEDSWQRNAEVVAAAVDRRVRDDGPDLVLLTGDTRAVGFVRDALGQE